MRTVLQQPQRGTGHAMQVARRTLGGSKFAIVLPGDAPLIRTETLGALARAHKQAQRRGAREQESAAATILSAEVANPTGYGRILRRDDGTVSAIVEDSALTDDQRAIAEINSSIYAFTLQKLWPALAHCPSAEQTSRTLFDRRDRAVPRRSAKPCWPSSRADADEVLGCNTRADLAEVDLVFRRRKRAELMDAGVTMQLPDTILVDPDVTVGEDTVLEPGVQLLGKTRVGANCTIRTGSILTDSTLEDNVAVKPYCGD